jgi:hypothetical protein
VNLKEIESEGVDWIHVTEDRVQRQAFVIPKRQGIS